jgi:hypothetical protein
MQDLNNEMDDLFRKAVEFYPLKPCPSQWEYLSTRIRVKKRRFLFMPTVFLRKSLRLPVFLSIMVLIPSVILSLAVLYDKRNVAVNLAKGVMISDVSDTESHAESDKAFVPMRLPISSAEKSKNAKREKKYIIGEKQRSLSAARRKPYVTKLTPMILSLSEVPYMDFSEANYIYSGVQTLNNVDRKIPEICGLCTAVSLEFDRRLKWRASDAEHKNLTLQHLTKPLREGFYLGLLTGPLFSRIKNQGMTKPGFDFGMLMGYAFSKKLSIETGIVRTRQYFTATGDYLQEILNMGGVKSLEGSRNAFSIPFKLKYNLISNPSGKFFFTAGVTTVVGVNDNILIAINYLPIPPTNKIELGPPSYLPAYLNFSLGYEYKIGRLANIRIEPYLEIPTNSSAGNSFKTHKPDHYVHVFNSGIHIAISQFVH